MMEVLYGLISMFGWGITDFLTKKPVKGLGELNTNLWVQLIGALALLIFGLFFDQSVLSPGLSNIPLFVVILLLWVSAYIVYMRAIKVGKLMIVTPISSSWGLITAVLAVILLGEHLGGFGYLAILLVGVGTLLASSNISDIKQLRFDSGVAYAIAVMLMWGFMFFLFKILPYTSYVGVIMFLKITSVIVILSIILVVHSKIVLSKSSLKYLIAIGVLDTLAMLSLIVGMNTSYASVVAPIGAAYPAVTFVLAYIFYGERISKGQVIGFISILLGVIGLSVYA